MCAEAGEAECEPAIATSNFQNSRSRPGGHSAKGGGLSAFGIDMNGHVPLRDLKHTAARGGRSIPEATPNGLELPQVLRCVQGDVPRCVWGAARPAKHSAGKSGRRDWQLARYPSCLPRMDT